MMFRFDLQSSYNDLVTIVRYTVSPKHQIIFTDNKMTKNKDLMQTVNTYLVIILKWTIP